MHTVNSTLDLALTYALRRPKLAWSLACEALGAAVRIRRPDLAMRANEVLCALHGAA